MFDIFFFGELKIHFSFIITIVNVIITTIMAAIVSAFIITIEVAVMIIMISLAPQLQTSLSSLLRRTLPVQKLKFS